MGVFAGMTVIDLEYNVLLCTVFLPMLCVCVCLGGLEKSREIKARVAPASRFGSLDATTPETPPTFPLRNCQRSLRDCEAVGCGTLVR